MFALCGIFFFLLTTWCTVIQYIILGCVSVEHKNTIPKCLVLFGMVVHSCLHQLSRMYPPVLI